MMMNPLEIRSMRKSWGMTQAELAGELGVSRETVSRWENGREAPLPSLVRALRSIERCGKA
jgi:DNA-binding transcriptional regulator YiaG